MSCSLLSILLPFACAKEGAGSGATAESGTASQATELDRLRPAAPTSIAASESSPAGRARQDGVFGRYQGSSTCLELFPSGEFALSTLSDMIPKVTINGEARQTVSSEGITVRVVPERIFQAHWIAPCRKEVSRAQSLDSHTMLNTSFALNTPVDLRLRQLDGDKLELCAAECEVLKRAEPRLTGSWRIEGDPSQGRPAGTLLSLQFGTESFDMQLATGSSGFVQIYGQVTARARSPGLFEVDLVPGSVDPATPVKLLGQPVKPESAVPLSIERLRKRRARICHRESSQCTELPPPADR